MTIATAPGTKRTPVAPKGPVRYAFVGTGGRAITYLDAIAGRFRENAILVGLCDMSQVRMDWQNARLHELFQSRPVPTFKADAYEQMIRQQKPDVVVVATTDATHDQYIIRAMELGCDVICEKPMTTDDVKARAIFDAIERTGRTLRITFNMRYNPAAMKVRELIGQGLIGRPLAVDLSWMLDTSHGADYFRRWHRDRAASGGLLVHKSTHHFDIVNWWVGSFPKTVMAMGGLKFYGRRNAAARGESYPYERYTGHDNAAKDPFALQLDRGSGTNDHLYSSRTLQGLYQAAEKETGYIRDRNVFGDDITIDDTMAVMVRYRSGAILNYSLVAYCPYEGYRAAITGDKGRIELSELYADCKVTRHLRVFPMFGQAYDVEIPVITGGHHGSDPVLVEQLFAPEPPADPLGRAASHVDGAASALIGISANHSIVSGQPVEVDQLLRLP